MNRFAPVPQPKRATFSVSLPLEMIDRLDEICDADAGRLTRLELIRQMVQHCLEDLETKPKPTGKRVKP